MNKIIIFTDGACKNNGFKNAKAGIGIYFEGVDIPNISELVPQSMQQTNNVAELLAIKKALEISLKYGLKNKEIIIQTDSEYSIKAITNSWKIKKNITLINDIKKLIKEFDCVRLLHVKSHSDIQGNVIADNLARSSLK